MGVKGSYPVPPEAKVTPVMRSWGVNVVSRYAGTVSLTPNSSAENKEINKEKGLMNLYIINEIHYWRFNFFN